MAAFWQLVIYAINISAWLHTWQEFRNCRRIFCKRGQSARS